MHRRPTPLTTTVITDWVTNIGELDEMVGELNEGEKGDAKVNFRVWGVLALLGAGTAVIGAAVDFAGERLLAYRSLFSLSSSSLPSVLLWLSYSLFFAAIAASCRSWLSSHSEGSGIPEMKAILSGTQIPGYLSLRTLVAKSIGLISAYASGLSIGREGPFVHIAGIVAYYFSHLHCISLVIST